MNADLDHCSFSGLDWLAEFFGMRGASCHIVQIRMHACRPMKPRDFLIAAPEFPVHQPVWWGAGRHHNMALSWLGDVVARGTSDRPLKAMKEK
ncbi:hypothetical protein [Caballeronia arvi]|uniref:hypothetical protein n=1 Tax=Caballeronia arvi TaxID=1777135 RepID=UPI001180C674|nr:hypothetical protein [Caballeronia arvi]